MSSILIRPVKPTSTKPVEHRDVSAEADIPIEGLVHEEGPPRKLTKITIDGKDIAKFGWGEDKVKQVLLAELKAHGYKRGWTFDVGEERYATDDVTGDWSIYCFLRVSPLAGARLDTGRRVAVPNAFALLRSLPKRKSQ